jgi:hypothetical protein
MLSYKIRYNNKSIFKIASFIESLRLTRVKRFENSWLEEILLTEEYDRELDKFYLEIIDFTTKKLSSWFLWEIQEQTKEYYVKKVVLDIRSYTLVLNCKQYLKEKTIVVEDIKIDR